MPRLPDRKTGKRALSAVLCLALCLNLFGLYLPPLGGSAAASYSYTVLAKEDRLLPIDASATASDNTAWYTTPTLARYVSAGYPADAALGAETTPYIIETGLELAYLATLVNGGNDFSGRHIKLIGSTRTQTQTERVLDLIGTGVMLYQTSATGFTYLPCDTSFAGTGWIPIGNTAETPFNGRIYAAETAGIKIYNLSAYKDGKDTNAVMGLFGYLGPNARVEGLQLKDTQLFSLKAAFMGALAASADPAAAIMQCSSQGLAIGERSENAIGETLLHAYTVPDFTLRLETGNGTVGGLLGALTGTAVPAGDSALTAAVTETIVQGTQTSTAVGGIIGTLNIPGTASFTMSNAVFSGTLKSVSKVGTGGLVGRNVSAAPVVIEGGGVSGLSTEANMSAGEGNDGLSDCLNGLVPLSIWLNGYAGGGFVGYSAGASSLTLRNIGASAVHFQNSSAKDTTETFCQLGGVVGYAKDPTVTIEQVGSAANPYRLLITGRMEGDSGGFGGIIGTSDGANAADVLNLTGCHTSLRIKAVNNSGTIHTFLGGILGRASGKNALKFKDCSSRHATIQQITSYSRKGTLVTIGGMVGGVNNKSNNSEMQNCTVEDWMVAGDGLIGGLVGTNHASNANIPTIKDCTVRNFHARQTNTALGADRNNYMMFGGITPWLHVTSVENCVVEDTSFTYVVTGSYAPMIGGIAGKMSEGATIKNCVANIRARVGKEDGDNAVLVGGLVGYGESPGSWMPNNTIEQCLAAVDFQMVESISCMPGYDYVNGRDATAETVSVTKPGSVYAGGLVGGVYSYKSASAKVTNIKDCFASGTLATEYIATNDSALGGLIGAVITTRITNSDQTITTLTPGVTVTGSVSTCSLSGTLQDGIGGLVGVNTTQKLTVSASSFAGTLLNPWAGSIVGYSVDGAVFSGLTYDDVLSPNAPATKSMSAVDATAGGVVYPVIDGWTGSTITEVQGLYYAAITGKLFWFDDTSSAAAPQHVFSVKVGSVTLGDAVTSTEIDGSAIDGVVGKIVPVLAAGAASHTVVFTTAVNGVSFPRAVKFIARMANHPNENGTSVPYTLTGANSKELQSMQAYVAAGGGFLGSRFLLGMDLTETIEKPIGMAATEYWETARMMKFIAVDELPFCGGFDGQGHTLTLTKTAGGTSPFFDGLFGFVMQASLSNVKIVYPQATVLQSGGGSNGGAGGLAGGAWLSSVNNVALTAPDGLTASAANAGGLVGYAFSSPVSGSSFTGGLTGRSQLGGLVGRAEARDVVIRPLLSTLYTGMQSAVSGSYAAGDIVSQPTGGDRVVQDTGGLIGNAVGQVALVTDSFFFGNVSGGEAVGGLIGRLSSADYDGILNGVYVQGNVTADNYGGGLVGAATYITTNETFKAIRNGYYVGQITCAGVLGAAAGNFIAAEGFYFDKQVGGNLPTYGAVEGNSGAALSGGQLAGTAIDGFTAGEGYPRLSAFGDREISVLSTGRVFDFGESISNNAYGLQQDKSVTVTPPLEIESIKKLEGGTTENIGDIVSVTEGTGGVTYTNDVEDGSGSFVVKKTYDGAALGGYALIIRTKIVAVPFADGDGSKDNPFQIPNVLVLTRFRDFINHISGGIGQYFELTMGADTEHSLDGYIYDLADTAQNPGGLWNTPIGTYESPFQGTLLGGGKLITNLKITAPYAQTVDSQGIVVHTAGLFGYVSMGSIRNLTVEGAIDLSSGGILYAGMLAAYGNSMTVDGVTVRSTGSSMAEGFAYEPTLDGLTFGFTDEITGQKAAEKHVGGLAGYLGGNTTVTGCLSHVKALTYAHGGTGTAADGWTYTAGGIAGQLSAAASETLTIEDTLFYGEIRDTTVQELYVVSAAGGIAGEIDMARNGIAALTGCAAYGSVYVLAGAAGGIVGGVGTRLLSELTISGCISTADVGAGGPGWTAPAPELASVGGIVGVSRNIERDIDGFNPLKTIENCLYGGVLVAPDGFAGGISGRVDTKNINIVNTDNVFDASKNYQVYHDGGTADATGAKATYELYADGEAYRYRYPVYTGGFGHAFNKAEAERIILGQSIALHIVRTTGANAAPAALPGASSVYVRYPGASLTGLDAKANGTVLSTAGSVRYVSTATDGGLRVEARIVLDDGTGTDALHGYGKAFIYTPSIASTGRTDASYLLANPAGDGLKNGSADKSFLIYNEDQLMGLAAITAVQLSLEKDRHDDSGGVIDSAVYGASVSSMNLSGYTIYLGKDIVFDSAQYLSADAYKGRYIAGSEATKFSGTLDGDFHTISGMSPASSTDSVGLFGYLKGAVVRNLGLTDTVVRITANGGNGASFGAGSLAGEAGDTAFRNVFSSARVEYGGDAPQYIRLGGLVGSAGNCTFENAAFTGSTGLQSDGTAYPAYGDTTNFYSGGLAGWAGDTVFRNSYVAGFVSGDSNASGAAGAFAGGSGGTLTLTGCVYDESTGAADMPVVGNNAALTADIVSGTLANKAIDGFTAVVGLYPVPAGFAAGERLTDRVKASFIPVVFTNAAYSLNKAELSYAGAVFSTGAYGSALPVSSPYVLEEADTVLIRKSNGLSSVRVVSGASSRLVLMYLECWYDNFTIEDGKKVYTIKKAGELAELALLVNGGDLPEHIGHSHVNHTDPLDTTFENAIVRLGADIVFNTYEDGEPVTYLEPVGTVEKPFKGVFDGQGHLLVNVALRADADTDSLGVFGAASGTLKNVGLAGKTVVGIGSGAPASVSAGTLVGLNTGRVENCFNAAAVSLTGSASSAVRFGGLVGTNAVGAAVNGSYNMGHITALSDGMTIGGLVGGNAGAVSQCYNTGILTGYTDPSDSQYECRTILGGIAGENDGTVAEAYNAAVLESYKKDGFHPVANGGVLANCFFDGQNFVLNFGFNTDRDGEVYAQSVIKSTANLSSSNLPAGFDPAIWTAVSGYYPQLTAFAGAEESAAEASAVSALAAVTRNAGGDPSSFDYFDTVTFFRYRALSSLLTVQHAVAGNQGTFTDSEISGGLILTPRKKGSATVHLYIEENGMRLLREVAFAGEETYQLRYLLDFSRLIADAGETILRPEGGTASTFRLTDGTAIDTALTTGDGTAGNPYLLTTADDLDSFAVYINASKAGGKGKYFQLAADIDYPAGRAYTPVGTAARSFQGSFSGNGYRISNIQSVVSGVSAIGLFGYAGDAAVIEMVGLINCRFSTPSEGQLGGTGYIGALAGYCAGTVRSCYSRSAVYTYSPRSGATLYAGGLVGLLDTGGSLLGCYARPYGQGDGFPLEGTNSLSSFVLNSDAYTYHAGLLAGKNSGIINGCYHTASYYLPVGITTASFGVLTGWNDGTMLNTYYNTDIISRPELPLYAVWDGTGFTAVPAAEGNAWGWSTADFKKTESIGADPNTGLANDSAAMRLSQGLYLGMYAMTPSGAASEALRNDGYPILAAFDLLQYVFRSFASTNLILNMQNSDATEVKVMNALCSFGTFSFPSYASVLAKTRLYVNLLSLPANIGYNVSAVAYGYRGATDSAGGYIRGSDVKWTIMNGTYTATRGLTEGGAGMLTNNEVGPVFVTTANTTQPVMPENAEKIYIYLTLLPGEPLSGNVWGIHHEWDSAQLEEIVDEEEQG